MAHFPHAVWAASGRLHGVIEDVHIAHVPSNGHNGGDQKRLYLKIYLVGIPGSRRLFKVRYYGPYTFGGTTVEGNYDSVLDDAYQATTGTETERWDLVTDWAREQLGGRLVVPINVGGRWIVR